MIWVIVLLLLVIVYLAGSILSRLDREAEEKARVQRRAWRRAGYRPQR